MNRIAYIALIFLAGCTTLYNGIDQKLYPEPKIYVQEAKIQLLRLDGNMYIKFWARIDHAEVAFVQYSCWAGKWKTDKDLYRSYVIDGYVQHIYLTDCHSRLAIVVRAYNNFGKRTQKSVIQGWEADMAKLIAQDAAKGVKV